MSDNDAPWLFLPLIGSFLAQLPAIRFDLMKSLKKPVDFGSRFRGRRVFGDNKTWRGMVAMSGGVFFATLLLSRWDWYWTKLPTELRDHGAALVGVLIGLGVVLAELPGSFLKRQLDIAPGAQRRSLVGVLISVWDQGDFVFGVALVLAPIWLMPLKQIAWSFVVVSVIHLGISVIGYALGARRSIL